ncbi:phytanoyl-CoA dioxygenase family protein [Paraburkholderia sediminicola]|uniref:phytanoyl-CoA dioxygenase family protein n=1 Tax=Paraburkholderia sediminicola TaxID=458836 RepID=UPI0038B8EB90
MQITNSVKTQLRPWFIDESRIAEVLPTIDSDIRPYAESIIENGFAVIKGSVDKTLCAGLIERFKAFAAVNPEKFGQFLDRDGHYPRIINLHLAFPELFDLFTKNTMTYRVQEAMFGATPCLYTSLFYERGSAQPPHRDTPVFSTRPEYFYFGVWVALEDANEQNGALQVYRGGHKIPELSREEMALRHFESLEDVPPFTQALWNEYQGTVKEQCEAAGLPPEMLHVEAGNTMIWHPQLPHGGGPIADISKSRFSLVMHTTPVGVPVYHQHVFFNPGGDASFEAPWRYEKVDDFYRVQNTEVDFGHKQAFPAASFKRPVQ